MALAAAALLITTIPAGLGAQPSQASPDQVSATHEDPQAFLVVQASVPPVIEVVEPLSTGQTVEDFYDYGPNAGHPNGDILREDTSNLFLFEGPEGLSLVTLHDTDDGDGFHATLNFGTLPVAGAAEALGLPPEGSWVVQDDPGGSSQDSYSTSHASWYSGSTYTDGGAYRGGLEGLMYLTVNATFEHYKGGTIEHWQFLSGDADDPDRVTLNPDLPVIVTGFS